MLAAAEGFCDSQSSALNACSAASATAFAEDAAAMVKLSRDVQRSWQSAGSTLPTIRGTM